MNQDPGFRYLRLFRTGYCTLGIAKLMNTTEADVYNRLHRTRRLINARARTRQNPHHQERESGSDRGPSVAYIHPDLT